MAQTSITLTHSRASDYQGKASMTARDAAHRFERLLSGCVGGSYPGATGFSVAQTPASGTVTFSASDGVITITINGVAVAEDVTGFDDAEAAEIFVGSINGESNPLIEGMVTASSSGGVLAITAAYPGVAGNTTTLAATGTGVTASGARLTGGVSISYTF